MIQYTQENTKHLTYIVYSEAWKGRYRPMNDIEKELNSQDIADDESVFCTLTDEDGKEIDFEIIGEAEIDGEIYYAMSPVGEDSDNDDGIVEYVLLKKSVDEEGEEVLVTVDDEDEFDKVASFFDDFLDDEADYDLDVK